MEDFLYFKTQKDVLNLCVVIPKENDQNKIIDAAQPRSSRRDAKPWASAAARPCTHQPSERQT